MNRMVYTMLYVITEMFSLPEGTVLYWWSYTTIIKNNMYDKVCDRICQRVYVEWLFQQALINFKESVPYLFLLSCTLNFSVCFSRPPGECEDHPWLCSCGSDWFWQMCLVSERRGTVRENFEMSLFSFVICLITMLWVNSLPQPLKFIVCLCCWKSSFFYSLSIVYLLVLVYFGHHYAFLSYLSYFDCVLLVAISRQRIRMAYRTFMLAWW